MFYMAHTMASSSRKTRQVQWKKYFKFCQDFGLTSLQADSHQVCRFLVSLAQSMKYSSINNDFSCIILLHKMLGS